MWFRRSTQKRRNITYMLFERKIVLTVTISEWTRDVSATDPKGAVRTTERLAEFLRETIQRQSTLNTVSVETEWSDNV